MGLLVNLAFHFRTRPLATRLRLPIIAGSLGPLQGMLFLIFSRTFSMLAGTLACSVSDLESEHS